VSSFASGKKTGSVTPYGWRPRFDSMQLIAFTQVNSYFNIYTIHFILVINNMGVRVPAGAGDFSLHHRIQNGSGAHSVS
jgi:hypothetical protein